MVFKPEDYSEFRYKSATFSSDDFSWKFEYELWSNSQSEVFTEIVSFTPVREGHDVDWPRVRSLAVMLGAVLGLSYYKAAAPPIYRVMVGGISEIGLQFLRQVLSNGLAEFAYKNGFPGLLETQLVSDLTPSDPWDENDRITPTGDPLVPIGGGKDSVVTVELLAAARMHPVQFAVNPNKVIDRVARIKGYPMLNARRTIDEKLLNMNSDGALNGHVPVTAMNSLIALVQARIIGLGPVVMSLEASASEPTLDWEGAEVNHQWSKSETAEKLLQEMLGPQAGLASSAYFSLLRPYSELQIARYFSALSEYHPLITSCNRAFRQGVEDARWCRDCDKCRFIFLILSPFIPATTLTRMFADNLLDNPDQLDGYRALVGAHKHRPFECVGEQAESLLTFTWIANQGDWRGTEVVKTLVSEMPELLQHRPELEERLLNERQGLLSLPTPFETLGNVLA